MPMGKIKYDEALLSLVMFHLNPFEKIEAELYVF